MIDLSTTYLGLQLKNPLVASASPLSKKLDQAKQLEEAGVSAIVMYSLFEEQIIHESLELDHFLSRGTNSSPEAASYLPDTGSYSLLPEKYLEHIGKLKQAIKIPIIGSLNGVSRGGWVRYARLIQDAGADALELNLYFLPVDPALRAEEIENAQVELVEAVKTSIDIPLAVKLSPYYTSLPAFCPPDCPDGRGRDCSFQSLLPAGLRHRRAYGRPHAGSEHASRPEAPTALDFDSVWISGCGSSTYQRHSFTRGHPEGHDGGSQGCHDGFGASSRRVRPGA